MSAGPEDETSKQMRRAHYEIGALWQRVRNLKRDKSDTDHTHAADGISVSGARVYLSSSSSINSSTWTKVALDATNTDPDSLFDSANNHIVLDKDGWWRVSGGVGFFSDSGGSNRFAAIAENGSRVVRSSETPSSGPKNCVATTDIRSVAGDTVELQAWQDTGSSLGLQTGAQHTWLSAVYMGTL